MHLKAGSNVLQLSSVWRTVVDDNYDAVYLKFASKYAEHMICQQFIQDSFLDFEKVLATASNKETIGCSVAKRIVENICFHKVMAASALVCMPLIVNGESKPTFDLQGS